MKVTVDVDCTPEEARRFLGLPDLTPVHQVYVDRMTRMVGEGASAEMFGELVKNWGPMSDTGMALWRQMADQIAGKSGR